MPKIRFLPHEKEITVPNGTNLIRAAMEAGVHINASCGGEGVCGKCRVMIEEGVVEDGLSAKLSDDDRIQRLSPGLLVNCHPRSGGAHTGRIGDRCQHLKPAEHPPAYGPHSGNESRRAEGTRFVHSTGRKNLFGAARALGPGQPSGYHPFDKLLKTRA